MRRYRVLGLDLDDLAFVDAVELMRTALADTERRTLFFANAHTLSLAADSAEDRRVLAAADFVFGDGTGVRLAARLGGVKLRANLNGTDLVPALLAAAEGDGRSLYLLGAEPAVVARLAVLMKRRFPGWRLVGHHHGFLDAEATTRVRTEIAAARPDLLLVGMGNPIQERWIAANADLPVKLAVGVGALFAYMTRDYRRAPAVLRRTGIEWIFVLFTQRHKARRYIFGIPRFFGLIAMEKLRRR